MKKSKKNGYSSKFSLKLYNLCQRLPFLRNLKVVLYFTDILLLIFIKKPKYEARNKKKVFIMYNYAFGDGMIWLNVAKDYRKIYPSNEYEITLICQKGLDSIYEASKYFDIIIPFNLTEATFKITKRFELYKKLREVCYDIVIDPIGVYECTTNVFMSRALVSKEKISILDTTLKNKMCPDWMINRIYDKIVYVDREGLSLIEYYAEMIRYLESDKKYIVSLNKFKGNKPSIKLPKEYYIVFPSASTNLKKWPIERYAKIVRKIYKKTGLTLLICGTSADKEDCNKLINLIKDIPYVDIIGKTSLLEFIYVINKSKFVVTNDTSTYHIAVTNEVPVAIITGGYTYDRYVEYSFKGNDKYRKPYIIVNKQECFNCDNKCSKINHDDKIWPCLENVSVDYAWKIIEKMIDEL